MSVYTHIEESEMRSLCAEFGITMQTCQPILAGVQNSNWFIFAEEGKFVFTLFERNTLEEITSLTTLMRALGETDLPVAVPREHQSGKRYTVYSQEGQADKNIQVLPCLTGVHPEHTNPELCYNMGVKHAQLHIAFAGVQDDISIVEKTVDWEDRRTQYGADMTAEDKQLLDGVWQAYADTTAKELPQGLIHADLFFDNTLWTGNDMTGLLDFTEVRNDYLLMDIAVTGNDFCTSWEDMSFDTQKFEQYIAGYNSVRQLTDNEQQALPAFLAMAAVRFWLFRLNMMYINKMNGRGGDDVLVKDPNLMKNLASIHFANC